MWGDPEKPRERTTVHAEVIAEKEKRIPETELVHALDYVQASLERIIGKGRRRDFDGDAYSEFAFDPSKHKIMAGPQLPVRFPLGPQLEEKLGEAELSEVGISLKRSPIGVEWIEISVERGFLYLRLRTSFRSFALKQIIRNTYRHSKEIATLFVGVVP